MKQNKPLVRQKCRSPCLWEYEFLFQLNIVLKNPPRPIMPASLLCCCGPGWHEPSLVCNRLVDLWRKRSFSLRLRVGWPQVEKGNVHVTSLHLRGAPHPLHGQTFPFFWHSQLYLYKQALWHMYHIIKALVRWTKIQLILFCPVVA